jgi:site-specific recombinase XerD
MLSPERHLRLSRGKGQDTLSLPTSKAGHEIVAALPKPLVRRIQKHIQVYRPLLRSGAQDGFLFPGATGGAITPSNLASRMKRLVETQIGADYNTHMIRHLVVTMLLDADPRNMPLAQRVLDHGCLKTTERWYGVQRSRGAQAEWMAMLNRKVLALRT